MILNFIKIAPFFLKALFISSIFFLSLNTYAAGETFLAFMGDSNKHIVGLLIVSFVMVLSMWIARVQLGRALRAPETVVIPSDKITFFSFFDYIAEATYKYTESILGHEAKKHYPFVATCFLFIFVCNLFGMIPGSFPPTEDINTTMAFGILVFLYYNIQGFKENGMDYLKHFLGPLWWLAPLLFVIELISHVMRPFVLGLRLRTNIFADHQVLYVFSDLVPLGLPMIFIAFGFFVAFMQAFIFTTLTMVYIAMATAHDH